MPADLLPNHNLAVATVDNPLIDILSLSVSLSHTHTESFCTLGMHSGLSDSDLCVCVSVLFVLAALFPFRLFLSFPPPLLLSLVLLVPLVFSSCRGRYNLVLLHDTTTPPAENPQQRAARRDGFSPKKEAASIQILYTPTCIYIVSNDLRRPNSFSYKTKRNEPCV